MHRTTPPAKCFQSLRPMPPPSACVVRVVDIMRTCRTITAGVPDGSFDHVQPPPPPRLKGPSGLTGLVSSERHLEAIFSRARGFYCSQVLVRIHLARGWHTPRPGRTGRLSLDASASLALTRTRSKRRCHPIVSRRAITLTDTWSRRQCLRVVAGGNPSAPLGSAL